MIQLLLRRIISSFDAVYTVGFSLIGKNTIIKRNKKNHMKSIIVIQFSCLKKCLLNDFIIWKSCFFSFSKKNTF